ncbi:FAD-dependent oxidoreductase [Mycobacterium sp. 050272]|uniref:FAD-dependent oxidoreductase n=1 Tax=Mycobacterium sp. 050272 TaxID=3142488 RepID=UPI00318E163C
MTHTFAPGGEARARIAVVGAGPAGLYAVTELVESSHLVHIDVFERLPSPFGLVRYGVAPDNQKIKSVTRVLGAPFAHSATVRFLGNVSFSRDISRDELRQCYDAVIYAFGAEDGRVLDIPGSRLPGSFAAKEFVGWYSGHPNAAEHNFPLHGRGVAVVGAGNVALDVARVLARSAEEIAATDVPDRVVTALRSSRITDIYLLCRRGPAQMKFTPVELRELGELSNADLIIDPTELALSESERALLSGKPQLERMISTLRQWADRPLQGKPRRLHLRFLRSPAAILGDDHVNGVVVERNELTDDGRARGSGQYEILDVNLVLHAVGYRVHPIADLPYDSGTQTIRNHGGRLMDEQGDVLPGEYVTGWAKRGPSGVIGTNRADAAETVKNLLADLPDLAPPRYDPHRTVIELLEHRGVEVVDWAGWRRLDSHEIQAGERRGSPRVKTPDLAAMLDRAQPLAREARRTPGPAPRARPGEHDDDPDVSSGVPESPPKPHAQSASQPRSTTQSLRRS